MITRLEEIRKEKGLTREQLSELSGVSREVIARLETGKTKNPTVKNAYKICNVLGVRLVEVFYRR